MLSQNSEWGRASSRCAERAEQQRQEEEERAENWQGLALLAAVRRAGLVATAPRHCQLEMEQRGQERPQSPGSLLSLRSCAKSQAGRLMGHAGTCCWRWLSLVWRMQRKIKHFGEWQRGAAARAHHASAAASGCCAQPEQTRPPLATAASCCQDSIAFGIL